MAPLVVSVAYPVGFKFDMDYYLNHHMPLVQEKWAPFGLKSWKIAQYTSKDSPYSVVAWLEFEGEESWTKASTSEVAQQVFGDIPNFTDSQASLQAGTVVKSESW
ncbi:hypothetical protein F4820DRAFT_56878 [Hypoxylon rubiginosum]|uniref:Uncharacterized protein n=1 Tax=Hypoxylon rubiginosum TaxID=110542 RepID=A0ACB9YQA4_9PEZI|nr:hypothetical protein F4820DRAFT_56878 [Hypoxylon rubiginosum]